MGPRTVTLLFQNLLPFNTGNWKQTSTTLLKHYKCCRKCFCLRYLRLYSQYHQPNAKLTNSLLYFVSAVLIVGQWFPNSYAGVGNHIRLDGCAIPRVVLLPSAKGLLWDTPFIALESKGCRECWGDPPHRAPQTMEWVKNVITTHFQFAIAHWTHYVAWGALQGAPQGSLHLPGLQCCERCFKKSPLLRAAASALRNTAVGHLLFTCVVKHLCISWTG